MTALMSNDESCPSRDPMETLKRTTEWFREHRDDPEARL